jgi:hypothetical protein
MQTIGLSQQTGKDGTLLLRIPLGKPEVEFEVVVIVQPKEVSTAPVTPEDRGWPPGYFDRGGSIADPTFERPPQGEPPNPLDLDGPAGAEPVLR